MILILVLLVLMSSTLWVLNVSLVKLDVRFADPMTKMYVKNVLTDITFILMEKVYLPVIFVNLHV